MKSIRNLTVLMATTVAILEKMRLMISEEGKGPLDPRLRASFCEWCVGRFPPEGLAVLRGMAWPTNACPCRLVSYCGIPCQTSDWATHKATCEQLRGADAESGEMPVLETGPADLASIHLAAQVKRLSQQRLSCRKRNSQQPHDSTRSTAS